MRLILRSLALVTAAAWPAVAQSPKPAANTAPMLSGLESASARYTDIAKQIWGFAEVGYMEEKSSALLQSELGRAGFTVKAGVA